MFGEQAIAFPETKLKRPLISRVRGVIMLVCLAFAVWAGASRVGEYISAHAHFETHVVIVRQGDTLWSIAREHGPQGWDVRKSVEVIREMNALSNVDLGRLQPGDNIKVPLR